ncbi:Cystine transporter Cystinosin [Phaffia rhodozyma]|uniref:Cystine transporter Cystinosin n=1 Tax=Phaffia rhodozyma TaxID=264483 RepID=A0A0F7SKV7_PHARH|nr:Cystine transporter Cystinosin [Phaffia rhodozyma]
MPDSSFLSFVSGALGWLYFTAWSASFYPQVILNYQRKSVAGFSPDFYIGNPVGHLSLAIFNTVLFFSQKARGQYAERHHGSIPTVEPSDVAFALHASTLAVFTLAQALYYPAPASQKLSIVNRITLPIIGVAMLVLAIVVGAGWTSLELLDWLYGFSYIKLYITVSKYVPQAYLNYRRRSTTGWSIGNVVLDVIGASLSMIQLVLDSYRYDDLVGGVFGNPAKLGLSFFTFAFDGLFLLQHYVLYVDPSEKDLMKRVNERDVESQTRPTEVDERTPLV